MDVPDGGLEHARRYIDGRGLATIMAAPRTAGPDDPISPSGVNQDPMGSGRNGAWRRGALPRAAECYIISSVKGSMTVFSSV
jgi:hypothetical protein